MRTDSITRSVGYIVGNNGFSSSLKLSRAILLHICISNILSPLCKLHLMVLNSQVLVSTTFAFELPPPIIMFLCLIKKAHPPVFTPTQRGEHDPADAGTLRTDLALCWNVTSSEKYPGFIEEALIHKRAPCPACCFPPLTSVLTLANSCLCPLLIPLSSWQGVGDVLLSWLYRNHKIFNVLYLATHK